MDEIENMSGRKKEYLWQRGVDKKKMRNKTMHPPAQQHVLERATLWGNQPKFFFMVIQLRTLHELSYPYIYLCTNGFSA